MKLLSPVRVGPMEVKNRVVSTAHSAFVDFWQPGNDGQRYMAYQERRAEGGTGLLILTAMHVHETSQKEAHFVYDAADMAPKYRELTDRVHRHGAKVVQQLFHYGVNGKSDCHDDLTPLWGFSGTASSQGEVAHEMTDEEIEEVIDAFASAAAVATRNGVDGVELHGTHGYLIQQSFSPYANKRTDKWGQHLYFAKTLAQRVRDAIGPDKALGLRISADDFMKDMGGLGPERLCDIAAELIDTGLFDYLNHSEGAGGAHYVRAIGNYRYKFGEFLPLTHALRAAVKGKVPVIGVGKIPTPDLAEQALEAGDCDLVGMTRAQISDPDLVRKVASGQAGKIRTCTGANQGCIDRTGNLPITCIHNPEVGEERRFKDLAAKPVEPKKVLVVGGGPAGIKAAEIAARRGHKVTLAEASDRLGGRLNLVGDMGAASNLLTSVAWVEQELAELSVEILTQTPVDEAFVARFAPDEIIVATGARPTTELGAPSDGSIPVLTTDEAAAGQFEGTRFDMAGTRALFVDMRANYETALVIEAMAKRGCQVTVVTPYMTFGANVGFTHLVDYLKNLPQMGAELIAQTVLTGVADGKATFRHAFSGAERTEAFDFIVAGVAPHADRDLFLTLKQQSRPVRTAGDIVAPRSALEAFREGDRCGRLV